MIRVECSASVWRITIFRDGPDLISLPDEGEKLLSLRAAQRETDTRGSCANDNYKGQIQYVQNTDAAGPSCKILNAQVSSFLEPLSAT